MNLIKKITLSLLVISVFTTGCEDNFLDVNSDPNYPVNPTKELVFPAGVASAGFTLGGQWLILGSMWAQHWTQSTGASQYAGIDTYNLNSNSFDRQYIEIYASSLNDLNYVSKTALEEEEWNYFLMAETMQVYVWQVMVDLYDKVPYSEALQGGGNFTPKFDEGQAIYDDLIVRLDNALAKDLSQSRTVPGTDDLVFEGDMDKWVAFANTLKLKIFLRQTEVRPAVAEAGVEALFAAGVTFLEDDAAMTAFDDVENFRNPYFAAQVSTAGNGRGNVDVAASNTLLNFLTDNGDPRIPALFNPPVNGGGQVGLTQGDYTSTVFQNSRFLSTPAVGPTHPVVFMSAAESKFLQAEAVQRYGVAGSAEDLYNEGVTLSFEMLGVEGADDLLADEYQFDAASGLEQIITQKWVATANFNALEGYFEQLRTGFPDFFTPAVNNVTGGVFPKRLPYPSTEIDSNREQLNAIGGQRLVTDRVWWDQ